MLKMQHAVSPCDAHEHSCELACHASPLGTIWSWWTDRGLFRLSWGEQPANTTARSGSSPIAEFDRLLQEFFAGSPDGLRHVRVDSSGWTSFFTDVYHACREIPAGETRRYAELAEAVGRPRAVRAVGQAMARNRVPLVIPCHRVVGSDGRLRGFSAPGGLKTKQTLLDRERLKLL
ncbi:MAG: methylated-DNA--[protein]-cysteine S-methyltransferase [Pirellulaceae bacterium]